MINITKRNGPVMSINKILLISVFMFSCVFSLRAGYHYVPYMNGGDMTRMPAYLWYAGCVPTSGCMVMGYWDNYGGMGGGSYGKNTDYGKLIQCYMDKTAIDRKSTRLNSSHANISY